MSKTTSDASSTKPKLTDAQLVMMRAALRREDTCLSPLPSLRSAQIAKTREKLITVSMVREVKAKGAYPVWRRDAESGVAFALKLTAAGAKAIVAADKVSPDYEGGAEDGEPHIPKRPAASTTDAKARAIAGLPANKRRVRGLPRPTSKLAAVVELLGRSEGATLADLVAATSWLPHTTRAALTGLRKRGYTVTLDRSDRVGGSVYRIEAKVDEEADRESESAAEAA